MRDIGLAVLARSKEHSPKRRRLALVSSVSGGGERRAPFKTAVERNRFGGTRIARGDRAANVPDEQHPKRMSKADSAFDTFTQDKGRYACDGREQLAEPSASSAGARRLVQHRPTTGGPD